MKVKLLDIGIPTPAGNVYSLEEVEKAIQDPNFISRLQSGLLCELGNPKTVGLTTPNRLLNIELSLVCGIISRVWIENDCLMGEFEFTDPLGERAQEINESSPVTLAMRSLTRGTNEHRTIERIITFDLVESCA